MGPVNYFKTYCVAIFVFGIGSLLSSCTDAERAKTFNLGDNAHIECYSGAYKIFDGFSTGKVENEGQSDGYFFKDKKDGHLKSVSGNCVIDYQ